MKKQNLLLKMLLLCLCVVGSANVWADDITITWPMIDNMNATTQAGSADVDDVVTVNNASLSTAYTSLAWADSRNLSYSDGDAGANGNYKFYAGGVAITNNPNTDNDNASVNTDCYVKFTFTVSAGMTFTPTGFSFDCGRAGTDAGCVQGALVLADNDTKSTSLITRPTRSDKKYVYDSHVSKTITSADAFEGGSTVNFYIYIGGKLASKTLYLANVTITGTYASSVSEAPETPTLTLDGGDVDGLSTTIIASTNATKIYYCWTSSSSAPEKNAAETWTAENGSSYEATVPNVAGTKYLHAYGYNTINTSAIKTSSAFNITKVKDAAGLAYAETSVAKYTTDANFTNPLTNTHSLAVTYSVEDGATATGVEVNASTGEVTIGSVPGTATIKASFAGNDDYLAGSATYVLTVNLPTCAVPTYTLGSYNYEQGGYEIVASCDTDDATLQYKIGNGSFTTCTDGVAFYAKSGKLVIKASKDGYNDATIASGIQWTLNGAPSSTSPETLIPFQTSSDDGEKNKAHIYKSVTFGENNNASSVGGVSGSNGLKIRTNQTHGDFANSVKFYVHDGYKVTNIQMTGNSNNDNAAISVNGMYVDGGDNAISSVTGNKTFPNSKTDAATFDTGSIEATDNVVLTFDNSNIDGTTGKKNNQLKVSIIVTYEVIAVSVSTKSGRNYGTYVTNYKLDFSSAEGITAYIAKGFNGAKDAILLKEVSVVPADEPIIVKTDTKGASVSVPVTTSDPSDVSLNALVAGDGTTAWNGTDGYTYYYVASDEFHKATSGTLQSGKAYLKISSSLVPVEEARSFGFVVDDEETTGVSASLNNKGQMKNDNVVYDLQGRRVAQPTKGLYIVNGRKFFKK